jgi:hypothetical protein
MLQLSIATLMVIVTVFLHLGALSALLRIVRAHHGRRLPGGGTFRQGRAILIAAFGLFVLHTIEIWSYAFLYLFLGAIDLFEEALYFSTVTYVAIGYGDVILSTDWRILGAIEGANGVILLGWSTAFFVSIVDEIRRLEDAIRRQ